MFGYAKNKLKSYIFENYEETVKKVCDILFSFDTIRMMSFFRYFILFSMINNSLRKTLVNFVDFWASIDR
jgi:hypothetical protein